ncbi:unnamed protein product [Durusdinium trenchii]|uniref:PARP catalytic domain-containing protein n=1 Tax=Durusdinium trenchii TaxID=1381693 RepID=A0ABP0KW32_9DINO
MGNEQAKVTCSTCQGSGSVEEQAGVAGFVGGALLGGLILGPPGALVGGGLGSQTTVRKICNSCGGSGKKEKKSSTSAKRDWSSFGGRQMTMYHGTSARNAQAIAADGFIPSTGGMLGSGVYLSADRNKAACYGDTIIEVEVRLGKTKKITSQSDSMRTSWSSAGYDSAWVPANCGMVSSGRTETCVADPDRIRVRHVG